MQLAGRRGSGSPSGGTWWSRRGRGCGAKLPTTPTWLARPRGSCPTGIRRRAGRRHYALTAGAAPGGDTPEQLLALASPSGWQAVIWQTGRYELANGSALNARFRPRVRPLSPFGNAEHLGSRAALMRICGRGPGHPCVCFRTIRGERVCLRVWLFLAPAGRDGNKRLSVPSPCRRKSRSRPSGVCLVRRGRAWRWTGYRHLVKLPGRQGVRK